MKRFIFIVVCILVATPLFAQDKSNIKPFSPPQKAPAQTSPSAQKAPGLEREIEAEKRVIRNSGFFDTLQSYVALRENDVSLCNSEQCRSSFEGLLPMRCIAEGRCEEIKDKAMQEICKAARDNDCTKLTGWKKDMCKGTLEGDVALMLKAATYPDFKKERGKVASEAELLTMLGVFWGFKTYNYITCQKYITDSRCPLYRQFVCQILFAADVEREVEDLVRDFAIFNLAKNRNKADLCNLIKNAKVKRACLNPKIKQLNEM